MDYFLGNFYYDHPVFVAVLIYLILFFGAAVIEYGICDHTEDNRYRALPYAAVVILTLGIFIKGDFNDGWAVFAWPIFLFMELLLPVLLCVGIWMGRRQFEGKNTKDDIIKVLVAAALLLLIAFLPAIL